MIRSPLSVHIHQLHTWIMSETRMGSLQIGILMMLNNDIDTKAFSTSRMFSGDTSKYVVKVARAT